MFASRRVLGLGWLSRFSVFFLRDGFLHFWAVFWMTISLSFCRNEIYLGRHDGARKIRRKLIIVAAVRYALPAFPG